MELHLPGIPESRVYLGSKFPWDVIGGKGVFKGLIFYDYGGNLKCWNEHD